MIYVQLATTYNLTKTELIINLFTVYNYLAILEIQVASSTINCHSFTCLPSHPLPASHDLS